MQYKTHTLTHTLTHSQKMTAMRKAKEEELFTEFQTHQTKMRDLLASQMAQATSDEDQRIAKAVAEQEAKRLVRIRIHVPSHPPILMSSTQAEERAKEEKFVEMSREIQHFTRQQLAEQAAARRELRETDQELLKQRIIQDQKVL